MELSVICIIALTVPIFFMWKKLRVLSITMEIKQSTQLSWILLKKCITVGKCAYNSQIPVRVPNNLSRLVPYILFEIVNC